MGFGTRRMAAAISLSAAMIAGLGAGEAQAQTLGIGPRLVFVSGPDSPVLDQSGTTNTRFVGGQLRFHASRHIALEVAMDYRVTLNPDETARIRNTPIQASILFFPLRLAVAPYFIGGVGWYKQRVEAVSGGEAVLSATTSQYGYHTGVGGQVMLGRHASVFLDYRRTFVDVKGANGLAGAAYAASSLSSVIGLLSAVNNATNGNSLTPTTSHQGSMWTTGMTVYF